MKITNFKKGLLSASLGSFWWGIIGVFYFKYFRIRSTVFITKEFDQKRAMNRKHIKFIVEPYKIHAYSLAIPGVSTGDNFKNFVHKTYNYIFK